MLLVSQHLLHLPVLENYVGWKMRNPFYKGITFKSKRGFKRIRFAILIVTKEFLIFNRTFPNFSNTENVEIYHLLYRRQMVFSLLKDVKVLLFGKVREISKVKFFNFISRFFCEEYIVSFLFILGKGFCPFIFWFKYLGIVICIYFSISFLELFFLNNNGDTF